MNNIQRVLSSFRDPSGFVFLCDNVIYRQINYIYKENFETLMTSGLYSELVKNEYIVPHVEVSKEKLPVLDDYAYKIIKPQTIPFISYPYEWCFSQLKDAALLTLNVHKTAVRYNMALKDCSAYNVKFHKGKPVFIDTLSFEKYTEGPPWKAYRQFCQHFLSPLALMCFLDERLNKLSSVFIDGIPVELAHKILPYQSYFNIPVFLHIHMHSLLGTKHSKNIIDEKLNKKVSRHSHLALIESLETAVNNLNVKTVSSNWSEYYNENSYTKKGLEQKTVLVGEYLDKVKPETVWDLGSNDGTFSRLCAKKGIYTVSADSDYACVEKNYRECKSTGEKNIIPIVMDLVNPSPSLGWNNSERKSLAERGSCDLVLALALIHHLAISNNIPFEKIAQFLNEICKYLVIEFVPKSDPQVERLLKIRKDIFSCYDADNFEKSFLNYFSIEDKKNIPDSERVVYLMKKR
ncbi:MAG: SAM-dependent methyltransferase [Elusimicrobia bacterium]|nr:SAM-dependent methyltransferase [Elusimicrobiota bacterium]